MRVLVSIVMLAAMSRAQTGKHPNYEDDVKPIFARRCFVCHSAGEMRSGLNLESYNGVLKGGGAGEAVKPGRPAASLLYLAVSHEGDGVPRMPLGMPKIPDAEIAVIRDWIQQGLLETASSPPRGPAIRPTADFKGNDLNRPAD